VPPTVSLFHLIDDMDHADPSLPQVPPGSSSFFWHGGTSFLGNWFVSSPDRLRDAGFADILPPRGNSKKACHVNGSALDNGVDLWAQLNHPENRPVDLSAYAGIAFWARLDSPSGRFSVAFNAHKPDPSFGAVNSSPGPSLVRRLGGPDWERLILLFDDFGPTLDSSAVASIDFIVGGAGEPFDLWIDDLMLLCRGICP